MEYPLNDLSLSEYFASEALAEKRASQVHLSSDVSAQGIPSASGRVAEKPRDVDESRDVCCEELHENGGYREAVGGHDAVGVFEVGSLSKESSCQDIGALPMDSPSSVACPPFVEGKLSPASLSKSEESARSGLYNLEGVVSHHGEMRLGHYTAMVRKDDNWFLCDDHNCSLGSPSSVVSPDAYILFYKRNE